MNTTQQKIHDPFIMTIGYEKFRSLDEFEELMGLLGVSLVIDVRSVPFSRKPGFMKWALQKRFGKRYRWMGDTLGGRGKGVSVDALADLMAIALEGYRICLLCLEDAPGKCHRHIQIARQLNRALMCDCWHVCGEDVVLASELQRSIDEGTDYECYGLGKLIPGNTVDRSDLCPSLLALIDSVPR
jgi:uncharacterized protein (DUF488 family)